MHDNNKTVQALVDSGLIATHDVKCNKKNLESIQVTDNLIQCNAKQLPNEVTDHAGGTKRLHKSDFGETA